eukprot:TRINITY_DN6016_c0_g1_i1.p1 TRINITY_DN6016_c0_g1~~TRINITY_DN6016_c0_g1_i1.p1  ORF type:complete len:64 (-),score=9.56 TRINITY_DN6016_c0_g1_i1:295-486(-)
MILSSHNMESDSNAEEYFELHPRVPTQLRTSKYSTWTPQNENTVQKVMEMPASSISKNTLSNE